MTIDLLRKDFRSEIFRFRARRSKNYEAYTAYMLSNFYKVGGDSMSGYVDPAKARVPLREKRAHKKLRLDSRNMEITVEKSLRGRSILQL